MLMQNIKYHQSLTTVNKVKPSLFIWKENRIFLFQSIHVIAITVCLDSEMKKQAGRKNIEMPKVRVSKRGEQGEVTETDKEADAGLKVR